MILLLDPARGGANIGAIGPGGERESDATLALALRLRELLQPVPGLEVRLTREKDETVPLSARRKMAADADLTLSVQYHGGEAPPATAGRLEVRADRADKRSWELAREIRGKGLLRRFPAAQLQHDVRHALLDQNKPVVRVLLGHLLDPHVAAGVRSGARTEEVASGLFRGLVAGLRL